MSGLKRLKNVGDLVGAHFDGLWRVVQDIAGFCTHFLDDQCSVGTVSYTHLIYGRTAPTITDTAESQDRLDHFCQGLSLIHI